MENSHWESTFIKFHKVCNHFWMIFILILINISTYLCNIKPLNIGPMNKCYSTVFCVYTKTWSIVFQCGGNLLEKNSSETDIKKIEENSNKRVWNRR